MRRDDPCLWGSKARKDQVDIARHAQMSVLMVLSGKSYLTDLLPRVLAAPPHNLCLASLSLDDLYLPHTELAALSLQYPKNKLLNGRGQPGTHDLPVAKSVFQALANINESGQTVSLPVYDKSRFSGKGDRSENTVSVKGPIDLVIFEGWCTGFQSLSTDQLPQKYNMAKSDPKAYSSKHLDYEKPFFLNHGLDHLEQVNSMLEEYETGLWQYLDCFVQLKPESMGYVWKWRLQQEHSMKAKNGGVGMTDEEVKDFIGRYMPGYELFMDGIASQEAPWAGRGMRMVLNSERNIKTEEAF